MDKMAQMEMQDAFIEDSLPSSAPMNNEVFTPEEILNNFGSITYAKGKSRYSRFTALFVSCECGNHDVVFVFGVI